MRLAIQAITEELKRLKASGQGSVTVSDEGLAALRKSLSSLPATPRAPAPVAAPAPAAASARTEPARPAPKPLPKAAAPAAPVVPLPVVTLPEGDKATRWAALNTMIGEDPVCRANLRPGNKVVTGSGSLDAPIMFIGDAPGPEEELQGEAFVGPGGQLLTKMISGMGISRAGVYVGYLMNWRPDLGSADAGDLTGNRPPTDAEMSHCLPYLKAQIEIVAPQILVILGLNAAKGVLGSKSVGTLGEVRGRWQDFAGTQLMVTYHPNYVLRSPTNRNKRLIWEDLLKVMERAKLPISDKQRGFFL